MAKQEPLHVFCQSCGQVQHYDPVTPYCINCGDNLFSVDIPPDEATGGNELDILEK